MEGDCRCCPACHHDGPVGLCLAHVRHPHGQRPWRASLASPPHCHCRPSSPSLPVALINTASLSIFTKTRPSSSAGCRLRCVKEPLTGSGLSLRAPRLGDATGDGLSPPCCPGQTGVGVCMFAARPRFRDLPPGHISLWQQLEGTPSTHIARSPGGAVVAEGVSLVVRPHSLFVTLAKQWF